MEKQNVRYLLKIGGRVQGVGFRPFVFNLAQDYYLKGCVFNDGEGVIIDVEGEAQKIADFIQHLRDNPPTLASIERMDITRLPICGYLSFTIKKSQGKGTGKVLIPPDLGTCAACRRELNDPKDRHYRYPFTNCTKCGPRFTIISNLPYDRKNTTMNPFHMCQDCMNEYLHPTDRRFHAQPVACSHCGPQVELMDHQGNIIARQNVLPMAGKLLREGHIMAVKGLGGFHLACDASNAIALQQLRKRKYRPFKPFAVMCRNMEIIYRYCYVTEAEAHLLNSPAAPIVLLPVKSEGSLPFELLAPGLNRVGMMLPYTPLHIMLLEEGPSALVMTSGNRNGLPLAIDNQAALEELKNIANYFVWHNRRIINRCDDSVLMLMDGQKHFLRRSRGYVPEPVDIPFNKEAPIILAMGGDMKNTFCLLYKSKAYLSQHIGEVDTVEGQQNLQKSIRQFLQLLGITPQVVTGDLHPYYESAHLAGKLAKTLNAERHPGVQHHHAHLAACMAENGIDNEVIGIILDGTGYGLDGCLWGFEIMRGDYYSFTREYHLDYVPLPGGEQAIRKPWITAMAYLFNFLGEKGQKTAIDFFGQTHQEVMMIEEMLSAGINMPLASSCGRLFDAVAAFLGVCDENTYEGQAAMMLDSLVPWFPSEPSNYGSIQLQSYPFEFRGNVIDPTLALEQIIYDIRQGTASAVIAKRFHNTIITMVVKSAQRIKGKKGISKVVLSGGVWHNRYLSEITKQVLEAQGFKVWSHHLVPCGDGGLALGQAMVASRSMISCDDKNQPPS